MIGKFDPTKKTWEIESTLLLRVILTSAFFDVSFQKSNEHLKIPKNKNLNIFQFFDKLSNITIFI